MDKKITRRDLLKALIAGSGSIVAAGFVPEKWLKPVVKSGVLPVHAQASMPDLFIRGGYYIFEDPQEDAPPELRAFAFVSYEDIPEFTLVANISVVKGFSFTYPIVDSPAKDANVILTVDGVKEEPTKLTDENGFVEWIIDYTLRDVFDQPTSISPFESAELVFKLENGKEFPVSVDPLFQEK